MTPETKTHLDQLAHFLAPSPLLEGDAPKPLRRYLDPSNAIAPKPQSRAYCTKNTIWLTLWRIQKYYPQAWDKNKWLPITVTYQATPERVKMVKRILRARKEALVCNPLSGIEPVAQPAPLNLVYGISRWSNPNRAAARHIDDGSGYPLCGGDGRKAFSWETEQGTPTCAKCIALAQPEAVTA